MREMTLGDGGDGADDEHARRYEIEDPDARDEGAPERVPRGEDVAAG